jgi:hypothetical protein
MLHRKLLISGLVVVLAGSAAFAKGLHGKAAGGRAGKNIADRLQKKLNLNEMQLDGVRALQDTREKELQSLQQEPRQKKQARQRKREINQRFISGVKALLTPEQIQQLPKRFQ